MASQFQLPMVPTMPTTLPTSSPDVAAWARAMQNSVNTLYRLLSERIESLVTVGTAAERPAADGTLRFYYATDTGVLYFDDGTWNPI